MATSIFTPKEGAESLDTLDWAATAEGGDHSASAMTALKPIAEKLLDIYGGANSFDHDAWHLFGLAGDRAMELLETFEQSKPHAGIVSCALKEVLALMRGAQVVLESKGDDRTIEEEGAFALMERHVPVMRSHAEAVEKQSYLERNGRPAFEVQHG